MDNSKSYSTQMQDVISSKWQNVNDQYNFESVVEHLNDFTNFRSFANAVVFFMKKHGPDVIPTTREYAYFEKMRIAAEVPDICSDKTWRNWKNDTWPNDRETAFKIAFALSLTAEETKEFFKKAFFDRPFDAKSVIDVVSYYCLERGYKWDKVCGLLKDINKTDVEINQNVLFEEESRVLENETENGLLKEATEEELIQHCAMLKALTSEDHNERLKERAKYWLDEAIKKCSENTENKKLRDYMEKITERKSDIEVDNFTGSHASLLKNIYGSKTPKTHLSFMKKMIINQLPSEEYLNQISKKECNDTRVLRNTIVLLSFYCLCIDNEKRTLDMINNELECSGAYPIYVGSPFDWIFVFSLSSKILPPLDCFQALYDSANKNEVKKIICLSIKKGTHIEKSVYSDLTDEQKNLLIYARSGDNDAKYELAESFTRPGAEELSFIEKTRKEYEAALQQGKDKVSEEYLLPQEKYPLFQERFSLFGKVFFKFKTKNRETYRWGNPNVQWFDNSQDENSDADDLDEDDVYERKSYANRKRNNYSSEIKYTDEDFKRIFINACIKAIETYDEDKVGRNNEPIKLTTWISNKCYRVFRITDEWDKYNKKSFSEVFGNTWFEEPFAKYVEKIDDNSKWIMIHRLGLNGYTMCNTFAALKDKMITDHSAEVDRDDILSAERKFIRIVTLSNAERIMKK